MARHLERPPADGRRTALGNAILHRPDRDRRHHRRPTDDHRPRASRGGALISTSWLRVGGAVLSSAADVRFPPFRTPPVFSIRVPQRRRDAKVPRTRGRAPDGRTGHRRGRPRRRRRPGDRQEPSKSCRRRWTTPPRALDQIETERTSPSSGSRPPTAASATCLAAARRALAATSPPLQGGRHRPLSRISRQQRRRRGQPGRVRDHPPGGPGRGRPTPRPSTATRPPSRTSRRPWRRWPGSRPGPRRRWPS